MPAVAGRGNSGNLAAAGAAKGLAPVVSGVSRIGQRRLTAVQERVFSAAYLL